jgi:hypothetical protein
MDRVAIGSNFPVRNNCPGYCKDPPKRRLAMICAIDNVALKGKSGVEIFPEFNESGI